MKAQMNPTDAIANPEETNGAKELMKEEPEVSKAAMDLLNDLLLEQGKIIEQLKSQPRFSGEWVDMQKEVPPIPIPASSYIRNKQGIVTHWYRLFPQAPPPVVEKEDEFDKWCDWYVMTHGSMTLAEKNVAQNAWNALAAMKGDK